MCVIRTLGNHNCSGGHCDDNDVDHEGDDDDADRDDSHSDGLSSESCRHFHLVPSSEFPPPPRPFESACLVVVAAIVVGILRNPTRLQDASLQARLG